MLIFLPNTEKGGQSVRMHQMRLEKLHVRGQLACVASVSIGYVQRVRMSFPLFGYVNAPFTNTNTYKSKRKRLLRRPAVSRFQLMKDKTFKAQNEHASTKKRRKLEHPVWVFVILPSDSN